MVGWPPMLGFCGSSSSQHLLYNLRKKSFIKWKKKIYIFVGNLTLFFIYEYRRIYKMRLLHLKSCTWKKKVRLPTHYWGSVNSFANTWSLHCTQPGSDLNFNAHLQVQTQKMEGPQDYSCYIGRSVVMDLPSSVGPKEPTELSSFEIFFSSSGNFTGIKS
jgi:hypothetical protein